MPRPPGDRRGGGGSSAGIWYLPAEACAGQMSAVSTGMRMAMMVSGQQADVDSVAPDAPRVSAAREEVRRQYPPPPTPSLPRYGPLLFGGAGGAKLPGLR